MLNYFNVTIIDDKHPLIQLNNTDIPLKSIKYTKTSEVTFEKKIKQLASIVKPKQ